MLILSRRVRESIMIGDDIVITILEQKKGMVRVGIEAPSNVPVHREEIHHKIQQEKQAKQGES